MNETDYARHDFVVNGVRIRALEWSESGAGPAVIMLHGVGSNALYFNTLAPRIAARYPDMHVLALDHRGSGDSEKPESGYSVETAALDVLGVADQINANQMILVGHSRGGWLAAYIAGRWPDRVSDLILIDPARLAFDTKADADEFYTSVRAGLGPFPSLEDAIRSAQQKNANARWTSERRAAVEAGLTQRSDGSWVGKTPQAVLEQLREAREAGDSAGPLLPNVTARVLLFVSSQSPEKRQAQKLEYAKRLPGNPQVEFVDASHCIHQDEPDLVTNVVSEFLDRTQAASAPSTE